METLAEKKPHGLSAWKDAVAARLAVAKHVISDARRRSAFRREIAALDRAGTLDAVLDDLGLARWEMNRIARGYPQGERLLPSMAYHRGVDLEGLAPATLFDLRHSCALCDAHHACRRWIAHGGTDGEPSFCPNAPLFDALREFAPNT